MKNFKLIKSVILVITIILIPGSLFAKTPPGKNSGVFVKNSILFSGNGGVTGQIWESSDNPDMGINFSLSALYTPLSWLATGLTFDHGFLKKGSLDTVLWSFNWETRAYMEIIAGLHGYLSLGIGFVRQQFSLNDYVGIDNGLNYSIGLGIVKKINTNLFVGIHAGFSSPDWKIECVDSGDPTIGEVCGNPTQKTWTAGLTLSWLLPL